MRLVKMLLEIFGWLTIVFGVTVLAALIAFLIYRSQTNDLGKILSWSVIAVGFLAGMIAATRIWKKYGTIEWLSGIRRIS